MVNGFFPNNILLISTIADLLPFCRLKNKCYNVCTYVHMYVHMYIPCTFDLNTYVWQIQIQKR